MDKSVIRTLAGKKKSCPVSSKAMKKKKKKSGHNFFNIFSC